MDTREAEAPIRRAERCYLCGKDLIARHEVGRPELICPVHSTRGTAHLRPPERRRMEASVGE